MIDINTIEAISLYVDHNSKKAIMPIPGSTLSELTRPLIEKSKFMLSSVDNKSIRENFTTDDIIKLVGAASYDDPDYCNLHQEILDKASKDVARIMSNNILLARSVVLPMIDEYTERLTNVVSEKCNRSNLALNIIEDKKRTILASPQLKSIVRDQSDRTNYTDILLPRYHDADIGMPQLRALVSTGQRAFDEIISAWIDVNELEASLKIVYNDIFVKPMGDRTLFSKYINVNDYQRSIIALLLCWGLVKTPQENISKSISDYRKDMEIFAAACSGMISQAISRYERGIKNKNLVVQYPVSDRQFCFDEPEKNYIIVDPEAYREFLELGGRPEMLFGSYLTGDRAVNSQGILADGERYLKEYAKQTARGRLTAINNVLTIVKAELRSISFDIIKTIDSSNDDKGAINGDVRDYEITFTGNKHLSNANAFIRSIGSKDIEDYYSLVRTFICTSFFEGSMVHKLLNKIDALDPDNTQDVNEMAIVATTDLIVDWLLSQVESDVESVSLEGFYTL